MCVIEKGSEVGAHILSGNVLDPRTLDELIPDWKEMDDVPVKVPAKKDRFYVLTGAATAQSRIHMRQLLRCFQR